MEKQYKVKEACDILGVTKDTIYRWHRNGIIKFNRVNGSPRIPESELKRMVKGE